MSEASSQPPSLKPAASTTTSRLPTGRSSIPRTPVPGRPAACGRRYRLPEHGECFIQNDEPPAFVQILVRKDGVVHQRQPSGRQDVDGLSLPSASKALETAPLPAASSRFSWVEIGKDVQSIRRRRSTGVGGPSSAPGGRTVAVPQLATAWPARSPTVGFAVCRAGLGAIKLGLPSLVRGVPAMGAFNHCACTHTEPPRAPRSPRGLLFSPSHFRQRLSGLRDRTRLTAWEAGHYHMLSPR